MNLYYSVIEHNFDTAGLTKILNEAIQKQANKITILSETEWEIPHLTKDVVDKFKANNIDIKIVYCSNYDDYYKKLLPEIGLTIDNVEFWGTYWLSWSLQNLKYVNEYTNPTLDPDKFKYSFISLNNRSHLHRCYFIEEMAKNNLIDKGVVTWVKHLNENSDFPYQYFDNRQILLDDDFKTKLDSFMLPKEFNQSLFHVVVEATHQTILLSEKTAIPIFLKKPFFVLSAPGFHKYLLSLGYKLYDELIDYSFDEITDLKLRTEKFVSNIPKLINLNLKDTYELLRPKIEYNYNRTIEIIHDANYIPKMIQDRYYLNKKQNQLPYMADTRYDMFMKWCTND